MRKLLCRNPLLYSLVFVITSCVTINIYFPAAAVEKAADKIVDEVWGSDGGKPEGQDSQNQEGEPRSGLNSPASNLSFVMGPGEAYAQEADINVTTPAIRALKESIKGRAESFRPFMDGGNVGIDNEGLLVIRTNLGLSLKDKAALSRLISAENNDRNALYLEIAKANNISPDKVPDIKKIFAGSWIKNAQAGWWVQSPGGSWTQK